MTIELVSAQSRARVVATITATANGRRSMGESAKSRSSAATPVTPSAKAGTGFPYGCDDALCLLAGAIRSGDAAELAVQLISAGVAVEVSARIVMGSAVVLERADEQKSGETTVLRWRCAHASTTPLSTT